MLIPNTLFETPALLAEEPKHKYSCLMAALPHSVGGILRSMTGQIDPKDLDPNENKEEPFYHITVLYGLHTCDPKVIGKYVRRSIVCELGSLSLFEIPGKFDVLKLGVESAGGLKSMNNRLRDEQPYTNSYPDYVPHVTVAYLKPGLGQKYLDLYNPLHGKLVQLTDFVFSTADEKKYWIYTALNPESLVQSVEYGVSASVLGEMLTANAIGVMPRPMTLIRPVMVRTARSKDRRKALNSLQP